MLTYNEIIEATGGRLMGATAPCEKGTTAPGAGRGMAPGPGGVSIDSRTIKEGELFIAIKGERFDGHNFLREALLKASGAIVSIPPAEPVKDKVIIRVENTVRALQDMASYTRKKAGIPVIGITGTNGKTTTKEMTAAIVGKKFRTHRNTGNLNNQIGLPLSILKLSDEDRIAVFEMGASLPGDILELSRVALPDCGVITNIGQAHMEGFKDIEAVRKTKLELLEFVKTAVINADDEYLMEGVKESGFAGRVIKYGVQGARPPANAEDLAPYASDVVLGDRGSNFTLHFGGVETPVTLKVSGLFNVYNALAAASVGLLFGVDIGAIKDALEEFKGVPMRWEIKEFGGATVISDVYNANPASMKEAVLELVRLRGLGPRLTGGGHGRRAIAVLGDMLELGSYAETAHRHLGQWMSGLPIDVVIAVGPLMGLAAGEFKGESIKANDAASARETLLGLFKEGDVILVKGSRGMAMEKVVDGGLEVAV